MCPTTSLGPSAVIEEGGSSPGDAEATSQASKALGGETSPADEAAAPPPLPSPPPGAHPPEDLATGLRRNPKYLPCRFLYDDRGSQLYQQITTLPEYYPYEAERQLLDQHAEAIAAQIPAGGVVTELGCGDCSKTAVLLAALLCRHGPAGVRFCGVDCSAEALRQTASSLASVLPQLPAEQVELVEAEYLAGIAAVRARHPHALLTILWLGSSVGNFSCEEGADFLAALHAAAGGRSQLLLATDLWKDAEVLRQAYDDSQGVSADFIVNGAVHALRTLGHPEAHSPGLFQYEPSVNPHLKQVEMWVRACRRVPEVLPGLHIEEGERVLVEVSRKFTPQAVAGMASVAGLCLGAAWASPAYRLQLLLPPELALRRCWQDTDAIFAHVTDWQAQPIALRHPWLFYQGHCAAFAKIKLLPQEPPSDLDLMFSRGMDPLVQNPSQCHTHPAIPTRWPEREEVEAYVAAARRQVLAAVHAMVEAGALGGDSGADGDGMRRLSLVLEHERMHQETLCYMAAQQRKADAAAATVDDKPAVLLPVGAALPAAAQADSALPFYLQPGTYAGSCTKARPSTSPAAISTAAEPEAPTTNGNPGSPAAQQAPPPEPATPTQQAERLAMLRLGASLPQPTSSAAGNKFVRVDGGEVWVGVEPSSDHGFLWDCELGRLGPLAVPGLLVAPAPVTVAQFRRFAFEHRGYERRELWDEDAFRHLHASGHSMPATWSVLDAWLNPPAGAVASPSAAAAPTSGDAPTNGGSPTDGNIPINVNGPNSNEPANGSGRHGTPNEPWANGGSIDDMHAAAAGEREANEAQQLWVHTPEGSYRWEEVADCPAYVSLAEAQAYCRLHGCRLMSEAEWELAASSQAAAAHNLRQLEEGGWEWTSTVFEPLPGFRPDPLYPEFSADFFDGQHHVLRGASPYTHPAMARRTFRNYYQRLYPFVFAKFRLARDAAD